MKNQEYVLVGRGGPGVVSSQFSRVAPTPPVYFANISYWVHKDLLEKLQAFEKPIDDVLKAQGEEVFLKAKAEIRAVLEATEPFSQEASAKMKETAVGKIIESKLAIAGGISIPIWQFTGISERNPYKDGQLQQVNSAVVLGEPALKEWSFFDRNVKHYFFVVVAKLMNLYAQKIQYRNWEPGQIPVPFAKKGQYPLPTKAPQASVSDLQQKVDQLNAEISANKTTH